MKNILFVLAFLGSSFSYAQCEGYGYFNFLGSATLNADLKDGEIADGDGDGVLDLFAINYSEFSTNEITGINSFAFTSVITNSNSAAEFHNFSISDVDSDGDIDVFILYVVNQVPNYVELFLNDGTNQFSTSGQVFSIVSSSENIALDDVDGDGDVDAVFSNSVYLNDGTGQFNNSTNYIGNNVSLADFDGDGDLDAINNDSIYLNNGSGFFTANPLGFSGVSFSGFYPVTTKIADIDGDGDVDVFRKDTIFINDGTGNFNSSISFPFLYTSIMYDVEFADIDGDGDVDVASSGANANNGGSGDLNIFINDGLGNFISRPFSFTFPFSGNPQIDIELADLNNDGYPDIVGFQGYFETNIFVNDSINYSTTGTDIQTACDSLTWIDGVTYTANNNTATFTVTNAVGCDSVVTLDLTINNSSFGTDIQQAACDFTWIDGVTYTSNNNTATHTLTNVAGCDSVVTLNLTINPIIANIVQNGNDIEASATNGAAPYSYDWSTGETTTSITPAANGPYWVVVSDIDNCFSDSATFDVTFVSGTGVKNWNNSVSVYPNPTSDIFTISTGNYTGALKVNVYDLFGRKVFTSNDKEISLKSFADGVYILEFKAADKTYTTRIIKE